MYKLGQFEYSVMKALLSLGNDAYGAEIRHRLQDLIPQLNDVSVGAVSTTLYRLEEKGMATSYCGSQEPVRSGKANRFYRLTSDGLTAAAEMDTIYERLIQSTFLSSNISDPENPQPKISARSDGYQS